MNAPPLLVSYAALDEYLAALGPELRAAHHEAIRLLVARGLPPVVSSRCLAALFGFSTKFIVAMARNPERYYRQFTILKGKKRRAIQSPRVSLKAIQKWFGYHLAAELGAPDSVFGFVPGKSAPMGSGVHCGAKWIYAVDIRNFFPSIRLEQVYRQLIRVGYPPHGAELISKLCCYQGALPQGSPASPVLSNLVFAPADDALNAIARKYDLRYSRYADDVVFSGTKSFPGDLPHLVSEVAGANGWELAKDKEYKAIHPKRLKVYGLLVNGSAPRLTKGYRNRIRAFKHLIAAGKIAEKDIARVRGHLAYANSIDMLSVKLEGQNKQ